MDFKLRNAQVGDSRAFNALLTSEGGQALFKAYFGQFSYSSLVEYGFSSLICIGTAENVEEDICSAFMAISDSISGNSDPDDVEKVIDELSSFIPLQVKSNILPIV